jgi:hypothetical protein
MLGEWPGGGKEEESRLGRKGEGAFDSGWCGKYAYERVREVPEEEEEESFPLSSLSLRPMFGGLLQRRRLRWDCWQAVARGEKRGAGWVCGGWG